MQLGIQRGYPNLPGKLGAYLALSRPFTWLAPIVGTLAGFALDAKLGYASWTILATQWPRLLGGATTLLLIVIGNNFVNQSTDEEDSVNKPYRPIVTGTVTRHAASLTGYAALFLAATLSTFLGPVFGGLALTIIALSMAYSEPPLRLKARPWLGNATIALTRGACGFLAACSLWAPITLPILVASLILAIFLLGATTAKDFHDVDGDQQYGVRTLPVVYGARRAAIYSSPFIIAAVAALWSAHQFLHTNLIATGLATIVAGFLLSSMTLNYDKNNRVLEGSRPWGWMYLGLLALQVALAA